MPTNPASPADNRILVKLRTTNALRATDSKVKLRPLYDTPVAPSNAFAVGDEPQWYVAEMQDGGATPWDLAHARVADQLGVAESDVIFAEPDLVHDIYVDDNPKSRNNGLAAVGVDCNGGQQDSKNGKIIGPHDGWHLDPDFSQLQRARESVTFSDPRTRIGHVDTGYFPDHVTLPANIRHDLERNFVDKDETNAADPDNKAWPIDNSGHGTGTISILAGRPFPGFDKPLGGAPDADIVPLRIADSVVLLKTSAFARALTYATTKNIDVISMSMGGLPSEAWREAVDRAYLSGLCMVTAAGNNFGGLPTRNIVYPARYSRVIAACGVMANGKPYVQLAGKEMAGNYGPNRVMWHALSAYSPNIPWAMYGCTTAVRFDGAGTSAATPQIAATVALWFEKYKNVLPRDWRRIEAVRKALFSTAKAPGGDEGKLGNGILQAFAALSIAPDLTLKQSKSDGDSFAFLRVITGLGIAEKSPRERMFNVELEQRWLLNNELQDILPDPDDAVPNKKQLTQFMQAVIEDKGASNALRKHVAARYATIAGASPRRTPDSETIVPEALPVCDAQPALANPPYRRLRAYAVDPSFSTRLSTADINEVTLNVRWEQLQPGPVGEYVAVEDVQIAGKDNPVDLNDPRLLAQDGWAPSEGNPQFHQQMVYAIAMNTIENFERALGRPVLWRSGRKPKKPRDDSIYTPRLVIRPHDLRQANAFYSPDDVSLKFGYFETSATDPGNQVPGSRVYSCLSHDIVAHETTHAILDGMHRRFNEPTNLDVLAFHEAFADIVALLQHFMMRQVLENEVRRSRGDIEAETMLGSLAVQFGKATGGRGALREAIGSMVDGVWKRSQPNPADLQTLVTPHERGSILVAAVFDAYLAIYKARIADLVRLNTGGTGVLPNGAIHPDLVGRLTDEATKSASHVLSMCIRALDYLPPVDVTFFEYLRALITADSDLVSDDKHNYRVAFVEAFRGRGIYPVNLSDPSPDTLRTLSVDTLRWKGMDQSVFVQSPAIRKQYMGIVDRLKKFAGDCLYLRDREQLFKRTREERRALHKHVADVFAAVRELSSAADSKQAANLFFGLDPDKPFEIHELRPLIRVSPDGKYIPQVVVALLQSDAIAGDASTEAYEFLGGTTLVVDLSVPEMKYCITKSVNSEARKERTANFIREMGADPLRALFFSPGNLEPFAVLHSLADDVV